MESIKKSHFVSLNIYTEVLRIKNIVGRMDLGLRRLRRLSLFHNVVVNRREYGYLGPSLQQMVSKLRISPSAGGSGGAVAVVTCTPPLVPTAPTPSFVQSSQTKTVGEYRNCGIYKRSALINCVI